MKYLLNGHKSERLDFRLLDDGDFDAWLPLMENEDAIRFLGLGKMKSAHERCEFWFNKMRYRYDNDLGGMNVLVERSSGTFIGQCGLLVQDIDGERELEIGYSILPKHWNKGFASEAARKCRDVAFENDYAPSIISITHAENTRSQRVALNNGMTLEKETFFLEVPVKVFRIKREDWTVLNLNLASPKK